MFLQRLLLLPLLLAVASSIPSSHALSTPKAVSRSRSSSSLQQSLKQYAAPLVAAPLLFATRPLLCTYYKLALVQNPLATKLVTGGMLALLGDAMAQKTKQAKAYDTKRAISFCLFDISYRAMQHWIFPWITKTCRGQYSMGLLSKMGLNAGTDAALWSAVESTLFNQLVIVPLFYYPTFFTVTALMQGLTFSQGLERARSTILPLMKRSYSFWLPLQFLQFRFIPEVYQIPVICVITLMWTVILSMTAAKLEAAQEETATTTASSGQALAAAAQSRDNDSNTHSDDNNASLLTKKRLLLAAPWRKSIQRGQGQEQQEVPTPQTLPKQRTTTGDYALAASVLSGENPSLATKKKLLLAAPWRASIMRQQAEALHSVPEEPPRRRAYAGTQ